MKSKPVLVIGGTGFIGSAVVRALRARGSKVRCLMRPTSDPSRLDGVEFERALGDLCDPASLGPALDGCRAVIHLASPSAWQEIDSARLRQVVVEGTRNLLAAIRARGHPRVVFVSSVAAVNGSDRPEVFDEASPFTLDDPGLAYSHAKREAEALCRAAHQDGLEVVVVNPAETLGPGDTALITAGALVDLVGIPVTFACEGGSSVVHVEDVAAGIVGALERGRSGERYILGGENLTIRELIHAALGIMGKPVRILPIPNPLARRLARLALMLGSWMPFEPRMVPYATRYWFVDSTKARTELGYAARPAVEVLESTIDWLRKTGRIRL